MRRLALSAALLAAAARGPQAPEDAGVFVVSDGATGVEVARETFRLAAAPAAAGGWTLATAIRFDRARPVVTLRPLLELGADSLPRALQFEVADGRGARRILAQPGPGRFTVREVAPGVERAREIHVAGRTVVLDDSVFALFAVAAWHARVEPVTLTAIYPRQGRRERLTAVDRGERATALNRDPARLRLVELVGETETVRAWLDGEGRLMKLEARGLVAERAPRD
jgi:hypothetical protein